MEGRCVHQIGLFSRMVSHGLCNAQGDIGDTLLMVDGAGVDQVQQIRRERTRLSNITVGSWASFSPRNMNFITSLILYRQFRPETSNPCVD